MHPRIFILAAVVSFLSSAPVLAAEAEYVINITVDSLGSTYLNALLNTKQLPNFQRLALEGAWTDNARTEADFTVTMPSHTAMITGRPALGPQGHGWAANTWSTTDTTNLHTNYATAYPEITPPYVASVFDVAHDNGLRTGVFVNKSKLKIFDVSYNDKNGAVDTIGADNGRDKIDVNRYNTYDVTNSATIALSRGVMVPQFVSDMNASPLNYSLIHFADPDKIGNWGSTAFNDSVKDVDGYIGAILNMVETNPVLSGKTAIIVTADHGGSPSGSYTGGSHESPVEPLHYTIPLFVWGPGVTPGADLYGLNNATRQDPLRGQIGNAAAMQPIRNGEIGNLSLALLGLNAIPGSVFDAQQDLVLHGPAAPRPVVIACNYFLQAPKDTASWTPGAGDVELGFTTTLSAQGGLPAYAAVYNSSTSPWRLRMKNALAEATFAPVSLAGYTDANCSIDVMLKEATYDSRDFFRAELLNGEQRLLLAEVLGETLNAMPKNAWLHYSVDIPEGWESAVLKFSSSTDSADGAPVTETVDLKNVEFRALPVPEPSAVVLLFVAVASVAFARFRGRPQRNAAIRNLR